MDKAWAFDSQTTGSSPVPSTYAGVAQLVEQGTENPRVIGSIPIGGTLYAAVAHLVERHLAKVEVASSSLVGRSKWSGNIHSKYGDVAKW